MENDTKRYIGAMKFPSTILILIRHGQARSPGSSEIGRMTPLSELGRRQAEALAAHFAVDVPPDVVYTSPLPRAAQTTGHICEKLGLEPISDSRLEEFELGTTSLDTLQERPDLQFWKPEHGGVDGVTLEAFSARIAGFYDGVVDKHPGQRVAVVSHAGSIDAAIRWGQGIPHNMPWMHEFESVANASITEVEFWPRGRVEGGSPQYAVLRRLGDVTHLRGLVSDV